MDIGYRVKSLRESSNLSIKELSQLSGVSQSYIREIETGVKDNISVQKLELICNALQITLVKFFSDTDSEKQQEQEKLPYCNRAIIKLCCQLEKDEAEVILNLMKMLVKNRDKSQVS